MHFEREGTTAVVDINCDAEFPDSQHVYTQDLVDVLKRLLPPADYAVFTCPVFWGLRFTTVDTAAGTNLTLTGNLVPDLPLTPGPTGQTVRITNQSFSDLRALVPPPPPPVVPRSERRLRVRAAGNQTAETQLTLAFLGLTNRSSVNAIELCHAVRAMIAAGGGVRVRCDLDIHQAGFGEPTE